MIFIFKLIAITAVVSGTITYAGMKFTEWWESRK